MTIRGLPLQRALMEHLDAEEMEKLEVLKIPLQEKPEIQVQKRRFKSEYAKNNPILKINIVYYDTNILFCLLSKGGWLVRGRTNKGHFHKASRAPGNGVKITDLGLSLSSWWSEVGCS